MPSMNTLADVFGVLNELRQEGVIESYALGGAMAMLIYAAEVDPRASRPGVGDPR
jgi:hypothetical protein